MSSIFDPDLSPIYSTVADDPCLGPIVDSFVSSIPQRVEDLVTLAARKDWTELQRLAHQLKGAAASYGFEEVTSAAALLETAARKRKDNESILDRFCQMVNLCQRIRSRRSLTSPKDTQ